MAKYKFGDLRTVEYTPSGAAISADDVIVLGGVSGLKASVGVAMKDVADGVTAEGAVAVSGVFEFAAVSAAVIVAGQSVSWDASASAVDDNAGPATPATGDVIQFGKAMNDSGNGETTVLVEISEPGIWTA